MRRHLGTRWSFGSTGQYDHAAALARLVTLAAVTAFCAGCGGADSHPDAAPAKERPTRAAFIAKADAVCRRADDEEAPLIYAAATDLAKNGPKLLAVLDQKHRTLSSLVPPTSDDAEWSEMLAAIAANIDRYRRNVANDQKGLSTREDTSQAIGKLTDSMRTYGFVWCP